jgi:hypothetical protein
MEMLLDVFDEPVAIPVDFIDISGLESGLEL